MAAKHAKPAKNAGTRQRIRNMAMHAMRDRDLSGADIRSLVHDALAGAAKTVNHEIPASRRKAMREAFEGLRDAFQAVAAVGSNTAKSATRRGKQIADHTLPAAARKVSAANEEFLSAVNSFAKKTSTELGEELEALVRRARRASRSAGKSASAAGSVAAKNAAPIASDAGRATWTLARRAAEQVALAASGLLEGIGQLLAPKKMNEEAARPRARGANKKVKTAPKATRTSAKKAGTKPGKRSK